MKMQKVGSMKAMVQWSLASMHINSFGSFDPAKVRITEMIGDSMEPTIHPGELLFYAEGGRFLDNGLYLLETPDGSLFVKRLAALPRGEFLVMSDNPQYENFTIRAGGSEFRILGKILYGMPKRIG